MKKELGCALIGCGVISRTHASQITELDGARLVAVADVIEEKAKKVAEEFSCDYYIDYHQMLQREDIDVVHVLTPSGMHADVAIDAARAGKHVISEKPMDITMEKARLMIEECNRANVKLGVISQHRFDDATVKLKEVIDEGKLGNIVIGNCAVNFYRSQGYYDSGEWRGTWALDGGGSLMNQSIHTIDLLQYLAGPIESIYAHTATLAHVRIEVEDAAVATVRFKSGAIGTIVGTTSAYPGLANRVEIFGTSGSAVIDDDELTHLYFKRKSEEGSSYGDGKAVNVANEYMSNFSANVTVSNSHGREIADFLDAIRDNREPLINGLEGMKPLEIILAIYQSAQTGQEITLPLN